MKGLLLLFILVVSPLGGTGGLHAQTLQEYADRLQKFGKSLQQEEVFLHMDNTCYFLGDTIYYKAYLRRSDGKPSNLSGLLYVDLFNQDGYLVERQKIRMQNGQGNGSIALLDTLYGGYYELRAYTRWQLNWGQYEHPHTKNTEHWFFNKRMAKEYYRDYDKLYSRVFPVYDKPKTAGQYDRNMTLRPLRRYFKNKEEAAKLNLTFYPEGGEIVSGAKSRVAFQADNDEGEHLNGSLVVKDSKGAVVAEASTVNRGRGMFELTCTPEEKYTAEFTSEKCSGKEKLPKVATDGVSMQVTQQDGTLNVSIQTAGTARNEELGLTVMNHGLLKQFETLQKEANGAATLHLPTDALGTGVVQLTVFNANGRIYADRLAFIRPTDLQPKNVTVSGLSSQPYPAFAPITMNVHGEPNSTLSVAVRDAAHSEYIYDNANIQTEMLLCSQLKGFVEDPNYYFESNDEAHQQALDLLLLVQGWRRYSWHTMATPKAFNLNYMPEKTETLMGEANIYEAVQRENIYQQMNEEMMNDAGMTAEADEEAAKSGKSMSIIDQLNEESEESSSSTSYSQIATTTVGDESANQKARFDADETHQGTTTRTNADVSTSRFNADEGNMKREVRVHAEFVQLGGPGQKNDAVEGDVETYNKGHFKIQAPGFEDVVYFNLAASDTTKWKKDKPYIWIEKGEDSRGDLNYPEFYVKLNMANPRFVKPYSYYQAQLAPVPKGSALYVDPYDDARTLKEVSIGALRSGIRSFDASKPAFVIDAYQAFNDVCDAGLCAGYFVGGDRFSYDIARNYIGDMNMERAYDLERRYDSKNLSSYISAGVQEKYNSLSNLDMVYIYTDYSPRREGDKKFSQDNQPRVTVDLRLIPNSGIRSTWRDRRYILHGYSVCDEFYQPDYSNKPLPETKDYRRTLYWNPNVQLDTEGNADIKVYNNSKPTQVIVDAEGMTVQGKLQTGNSYPEKR